MGQLIGRVSGALMFAGSAQFLVCMLIAECLYPHYSVSLDYISELGALSAVTAPLFNASVIVLGLTAILAAYFLRRGKVITNKVFLGFLVLCGIGCIGVGAFPMDSPVPYAHLIAALLAFLFGALAAIASFKFQRAPASYFSVILGIVSLLALVLFTARIDLGLGIGGIERMVSYPTLLWSMMFGGYLMKE
jgi:hypothetical membrane protein